MPGVRYPREGSKYYIPKQKFRTVTAFCLSYPELKQELRELTVLQSAKVDAQPHASDLSDPTYRAAVRLAKTREKIELIENAVRECSGVLYPWMISAVTEEGFTWDVARARGIPTARNNFLDIRRQIYYFISMRI